MNSQIRVSLVALIAIRDEIDHRTINNQIKKRRRERMTTKDRHNTTV